jgi:hypothetical protein
MAATGRDVATFVVGIALAGLSPVFLFSNVELLPMLGVFGDVFGAIPLHQIGLVAFIALLGAAWVDTGRNPDPEPDTPEWDT